MMPNTMRVRVLSVSDNIELFVSSFEDVGVRDLAQALPKKKRKKSAFEQSYSRALSDCFNTVN